MTERITLRDLTTQLEHGDGSNVTNAFSGKFEEERFRDLDAIRKLNQADLKAGTTDTTLQIQYGIHNKDHISISATKGSYDEFMGGKSLYIDDLDINKLQHTDSKDKVPGLRQSIDIAKLTSEAEGGDGKAIAQALDGKYQEERALILESVEMQNKMNLDAHRTNDKLDISVAGTKSRAAEMTVVREQPTSHDFWMGGVQIYSESLSAQTGERQTLSKRDERK